MIGDSTEFVLNLLAELEKTNINFSNFLIDHICYRVSNYRNYSQKKQQLAKLGHMLTETEVNGRPIACFKLHQPIVINYKSQSFEIPLIELPAPKKAKVSIDGLEHFEMATSFHPQKMQLQYPRLTWNTSGMNKVFNPEIELEFSSGAVKFHQQSLEQVITTEIKQGLLNFTYEDEHILAIDKPAGFFIQPPENSGFYIDPNKICLNHLEDHFKTKIYPIHRLDSPTTGLTLFAKSRQAAVNMSALFKNKQINKKYWAFVRGHTDQAGEINLPLQNPKTGQISKAFTAYRTLAKIELLQTVQKYPTSRYSLIEVAPQTGKWHQIRRHFDQIAHPLIGDIVHGDSHHNRFFRDELGLQGLWLRATELKFEHPISRKPLLLIAPTNLKWEKILQLFLEPI